MQADVEFVDSNRFESEYFNTGPRRSLTDHEVDLEEGDLCPVCGKAPLSFRELRGRAGYPRIQAWCDLCGSSGVL